MVEINTVKIGESIKIRRIKRKISQMQLAEELGISQTHLSNAENGRVMLSLKTLLKVRAIFNCTLDELLGLKNSPEISGGDDNTKKFAWGRHIE